MTANGFPACTGCYHPAVERFNLPVPRLLSQSARVLSLSNLSRFLPLCVPQDSWRGGFQKQKLGLLVSSWPSFLGLPPGQSIMVFHHLRQLGSDLWYRKCRGRGMVLLLLQIHDPPKSGFRPLESLDGDGVVREGNDFHQATSGDRHVDGSSLRSLTGERVAGQIGVVDGKTAAGWAVIFVGSEDGLEISCTTYLHIALPQGRNHEEAQSMPGRCAEGRPDPASARGIPTRDDQHLCGPVELESSRVGASGDTSRLSSIKHLPDQHL
ncbi:hypothetical protein EDB80DRAFT_273046 [Ilyonectria destructans]|nr:hypothetical protein EDB80DRAFT_273046 [Ilyonectria destructans]